jgi:hypothetical protein
MADNIRKEGESLKDYWERWSAPDSLEECVKLFFELIDKVETSSNGVDFKPNRMTINSCRVWDTNRLNRIIPRMKELAKHQPTNT